MFGIPKRTKQPQKPREAKDIVKESDKALMITEKAGDVQIHVLKNVKYRNEVKGILQEALDSYMTNPVLNTLLNVFKGLRGEVLELKKEIAKLTGDKNEEKENKKETHK